MDRSTIFRWRQEIAFARELDRQRRLRSERAANQLQSMVPSALKILQQQLDSSDGRERMRAISILLRFATPGRLGTVAAPGAGAVAGAGGGGSGGAAKPQPPDAAVKAAQAESKRHTDDLIAFIEAPLPGEPGAPEDMTDGSEEEEDLE